MPDPENPDATKASTSLESWSEAHGHDRVQRLVHDLSSERDPDRIKGLLVALETLLSKHFEEETAPGGWFDEMLEQRPSNAHQLESLKAEHAAILRQLDGLVVSINALLEKRERIHRAKAGLVELIGSHIQAEHRLCLDTELIDYGGG